MKFVKVEDYIPTAREGFMVVAANRANSGPYICVFNENGEGEVWGVSELGRLMSFDPETHTFRRAFFTAEVD